MEDAFIDELQKHSREDEHRFELIGGGLKNINESVVSLGHRHDFLEKNHVAHIESDIANIKDNFAVLNTSVGKIGVEISWIKWLIIPIFIPVLESVVKMVRTWA